MRTRHQITGAAIVAASALGGVGLTLAGPSGTADATPAVSSTAASTSCTTSSRVFQLRGGGTQVWAATISKANSTKPTTYGWRQVYTVSGAKGLSIAAHSEGKESIQILLSDQTGALRSLAYNKKDGKVTSTRTLAKGGTTTKPGAYRFTSLTSDGTRVWGAGGGHLTVMTGISTTKAPTGRSTVAGLKGFYPAAFWANAGGSYEIAWTDSKGNVRYGNISATKGWHLANTVTVAKGWTSDAIATPGAGIVLRSSGDSLVRHQVNPSAKTGKVTRTTTLTKTFKAPNTVPMTTVPDVCKAVAPPQSSTGQKIVDKAATQLGTPEGPQSQKYATWAWPGFDTTNDSTGPWCAAFVSWVTNHELGLTSFKDASVGNWVTAARNKQHGLSIVSTPKPGDLVAYDWNGGSDFYGSSHIGIVRSVNSNGTFNTIDGNVSNSSGSDEGVYPRYNRSKSSAPNVTFIRVGG